ncbi:MAG: AAA family ATPase [Pseudolabrys sp.]
MSTDELRESDPQGQDAVIAALSDPAFHGGAAVDVIETHAAMVFLAGNRALKIKRAVRFPFLDYSTLRLRRAACEAELRVNRVFAPQIYRRVVAITHDRCGKFTLDGDGPTAEWAVEMQRFDPDETFDRIAEREGIDEPTARALADAVLAAHARAPAMQADRWLAALREYLTQNDDAFIERSDLFDVAAVRALSRRSRETLDALRPLLRQRGRDGFIRRLHGDLHLGNIVRLNGAPVLFDAIEFDEWVATGDVLYDLAFLLMDLWARDLPLAANQIFNRYLQHAREPSHLDALAALPLFLSLRAAIRAKVTAARLTSAHARDPEIAAQAKHYFRLACDFIAPRKPALIAVGGLSGTGKSLLARALCAEIGPAPGAVLLRSDVARKNLSAVPETQRLPATAYTQKITRRVYDGLLEQAGRVLAAGHSVLVDAVFAQPQERAQIDAVAQDRTCRHVGLFLEADLATRMKRVGARIGDASDADAAVVQRQSSYDLGRLTWRRIDASGTPDDTLNAARTALADNDPDPPEHGQNQSAGTRPANRSVS